MYSAVALSRASGFSERQARFLKLVLEHSGVCLPRQYRAFAGVAHGRETHRFFERLIAGGFASSDLSAPAHAGRLYHLQYKPWYRLLGEPDHRHRRPMSVGRAVERLMVLDGVLAEPDVTWLGLARDKVAGFTNPPWCVPPGTAPQLALATSLGRHGPKLVCCCRDVANRSAGRALPVLLLQQRRARGAARARSGR